MPLLSLAVGPEQIAAAVEVRQALAQAGGLDAADRFVASARGLTRAARDLVRDWAGNNVRGIFESRGSGSGSGGSAATVALSLVDDLEYRVYGLDPAVAGSGFFAGTLLPLAPDDSAWLAAGTETGYPLADGRQVARLAIDMATREPDLVFRNPVKVAQGWEHMRRDREEFLAFFSTDELVLPALEAEGRLNAYYKRRRDSARAARGRHRAVSEAGETTFVMPEGFFEFDTVGIIYDELDGFVVVPEYGMLRALFADPALAADREHANVLRAYLREDAIPPLPLRRMAAAYPGSVDPVFRRVLGNRNFSWSANGPGLLRKRKPGYYESEPTPGVAVLSDRVMALTRGGALVPGRHEVRVELDEGIEEAGISEGDQRPHGRLAVQAGARERRVEQRIDERRVRAGSVGPCRIGAESRLDRDVAQRERLHEQAARELKVRGRPGGVAQPESEHLGQDVEHRHQRVAGPPLRILERGRDLLACLPGSGRAKRGGQRHVQPPRWRLAQRPVIACRGDPEDFSYERAATRWLGEQVAVAGDDPPRDRERLRVKDGAVAEPAASARKVAEQVVDVVIAVRPDAVDRAARHPGPLDDLFHAQTLDGERGADLKRQFAAGVEHALPDLFRGHAFRPDRHGRFRSSPRL